MKNHGTARTAEAIPEAVARLQAVWVPLVKAWRIDWLWLSLLWVPPWKDKDSSKA